jgi:hypothetical protein
MDNLFKEYNFPSLNKFYQILKDKGLKYTRKEIKEFIDNQNVNQVHSNVVERRSNQLYITANEPNEIFQIDLLDYQKYSTTNKGFKWILICVDVFTRKAFAEPVKSKTSTLTKIAFENIVNQAKPKVVFHDEGNEWKGQFLQFVNEKDIINVDSNSKNHHALGIIDRFSKTLKNIIAKFMTNNNNTQWVNILPNIIKSYNNSPHSTIFDYTPNSIEQDEEKLIEVSTLNIDKQIINNNIIKKKLNNIKVGDSVRTKIKKGTFDKGYEITFSKEVFKVEEINGTKLKLNNNKEYSLSDVMKVPKSALSLENKEKNKLDKENKVKRKLQREGIL